MCVSSFCTTFVRNISRYKKNWASYDSERVLVVMWSARYSFQILIKIEFL